MLTSRCVLPMLQFSLSMLRRQLYSDVLLTIPNPKISIYTEGQFLVAFIPKPRAKQAILLPVRIGRGIATGIGTEIGDMGSSVELYHKLSPELNEDIE